MSNNNLHKQVNDEVTLGNWNTVVGSLVPQNTIMMWWGNIENIPDGWKLCDGKDADTPDLRDRFIVGAGKEYKLNDTGGETSVTLSMNQMPKHKHDVRDGGHTHTTSYTYEIYDSDARNNKTGGDGDSDSSNSVSEGHAKIIENYQGNNAPHENRPPYYALYYIMKMS